MGRCNNASGRECAGRRAVVTARPSALPGNGTFRDLVATRFANLFRRDQLFDHATRMYACRVAMNIEERLIWRFECAGLLRFDNHLVLVEGSRDFVEQLLRRGRLVLTVAIGHRPEIMAGGCRFRRDAVKQPKRKAATPIALGPPV